LGKDSIRYENTVTVENKVYKNLKIFTKNKKKEEDLFDLIQVNFI
jgi:DNA topoisomerase-1